MVEDNQTDTGRNVSVIGGLEATIRNPRDHWNGINCGIFKEIKK